MGCVQIQVPILKQNKNALMIDLSLVSFERENLGEKL